MAAILVVDDTPDICRALARLLRSSGHAAHCVASGEDALTALAGDPLPDLVILDQMMPGIDGLEVLRRLRNDPRTARLRVVMFSALSDPTFQAHARGKGADAYWPKAGFDYSRLDEMVSTALSPFQS